MIEWFYLALGFALLFILHEGERKKKDAEFLEFSLELSLGFTFLMAIDLLSSTLLWDPLEWGHFRFFSIFLWALLLDQARRGLKKRDSEKWEVPFLVSPFLLALLSFYLWTPHEHFLAGLGLCFGSGFFEWLLRGLKERVKLSQVPEVLTGPPLLFWMAALLFLAFSGFQR